MHHRNLMQQTQHFYQQRLPLDAARRRLTQQVHHLLTVTLDQRLQQPQRLLIIQRAKHDADRAAGHRPLPHGNGLVSEAQRIAHTAIGSPCQELQRTGFTLNLFLLQDMLKLLTDLIDIQRLEVKLQTARKDGHRQFLRIGRGQ